MARPSAILRRDAAEPCRTARRGRGGGTGAARRLSPVRRGPGRAAGGCADAGAVRLRRVRAMAGLRRLAGGTRRARRSARPLEPAGDLGDRGAPRRQAAVSIRGAAVLAVSGLGAAGRAGVSLAARAVDPSPLRPVAFLSRRARLRRSLAIAASRGRRQPMRDLRGQALPKRLSGRGVLACRL